MSDYKNFIKTDSYALQSTVLVTPEVINSTGTHTGKWKHIFVFNALDLEADSLTIIDHISNEEKELDLTSISTYLPDGFYIPGYFTKIKIGSGKAVKFLAFKA